jgi:nicotinate dehydrogenase subunit A
VHATNPGPANGQDAAVTLLVNGTTHRVQVARKTALLYVLRNDLALNGPKFGCGLGECGACAVLVGDTPARSCCIPVGSVEGRAVTTLEGLAVGGEPGRVQAAFIAEQAVQCGYCLNGMIIATEGLLRRVRAPTEDQIRGALSHNLCRCGTHVEILRAVRRAAASGT